MIAKMRGYPDPSVALKTPSHNSRTPGRSPKKQMSPRKQGSPSKLPSPTKSRVYNDPTDHTAPLLSQDAGASTHAHPTKVPVDSGGKSGLKEINVNVVPRPGSSSSDGVEDLSATVNFAKSLHGVNGAPPLKRHATTSAMPDGRNVPGTTTRTRRGKSTIVTMVAGVENLGQSIGAGGPATRRLRSSPPG